jgi:hypothetical protein
MQAKQVFETLSPYDNFLYALKSKETKRQYPHRLDRFLSYLGLEGSIKEKCATLYKIGKDINLLESHIIRFINSQIERIENKEITEGTLCNYIEALKLFCSMNDIIINWKKLRRFTGETTEIHDDRAYTYDEIKRLLEISDLRPKVTGEVWELHRFNLLLGQSSL